METISFNSIICIYQNGGLQNLMNGCNFPTNFKSWFKQTSYKPAPNLFWVGKLQRALDFAIHHCGKCKLQTTVLKERGKYIKFFI